MSIEADLSKHLNDEAQYQKRYEEAEKKVLESPSTIDGFLQQLYDDTSDEDMDTLKRCLNSNGKIAAIQAHGILQKYYNKHVDWLIRTELGE